MEQLTGLDAAFLYLENPVHHMHVAMTMVLDPSTVPGGYDFDTIKEFIAGRIHLVPPFRRRLLEVPLNLAHPMWVEDPDFDLDFHVRRIGCPAPGGRRELGEMAGQIASTPLDRTRPLWELWVIEGLKHDRIGVVTKVHHAAIDGASGAELMVHLFDLQPEPPDPGPPPVIEAEPIPTDLDLIGRAVANRVRRTLALPKLLGETIGAVSRVVSNRRDPEKLVGAAPLTAPRAPWNGPISPFRDVGLARVPLDEIRELKDAFGCTVNDIVLAICAGTMRSYLLDHGQLPDAPLVATCPVSVRAEDDAALGNRVSAMFTNLDTNVADPVERLRRIRECTAGAKEEHNAIGASMLQNWAEYAAPNTFNLASRLYSSLGVAGSHRPVHNLIVSNIPGPQFKLYYAGAEMVAAYPMGPIMEGVGLNISVMSYSGSVDFGFMVDRELLPDVWNMADRVKDALAELHDAAAEMRAAGAETPDSAPASAEKAGTDRRTVAKKASAERAAGKKAPAAKTAGRKAATKKAATRTAGEKAAKKKATGKKTAGTKKAAGRKTAGKKKAATKAAGKRAATKKAAPAEDR